MLHAIFHDGKTLKKAIVSPPEKEYFHIDNLEAHNIREVVNIEKTKEQHRILRHTMRAAGVEVTEIPELPGHPNSIFTMDTALSLGDCFIKLRMGLPTRRGEENWMAKILGDLKLEKIGEIIAPGTAEGGDLIPAYPYFFIGHSRRTNMEGAKQLSRILNSLGYEIRIVKVPDLHLHLGGAMTIIGEDKVLACKSIPDESLKNFEVIRIDCKFFISGNVINLGNEKIIVEKRNKEACSILSKEGYEVIPLDFSEFVKGSGGPSCLILPLERG